MARHNFFLILLIPLVLACAQLGEFKKPETQLITICESKDHIAFPGVTKLSTGELVAVFREGQGHVSPEGKILLCRSRNGGYTWSDPDTIMSTPLDCRDASIATLPDGSLLLNFFQSRYDSAGKIIGALGVFVARSYDAGQTWLPARMVHVAGFEWSACSDAILVRKDNSLLLPVYGAKKGEKSAALVAISRDMGTHWDEIYTIAYDSTGRLDYNEPALVDLPDGRILCVLRTAGHGHFQYQCYSEDGGKTWSKPFRTNIQGQAAGLLLTDDNILVCGYRDFSPNGTSYSLSYDYGQTWEQEHIIKTSDHDRAYISFASLGDGRVFGVFYEASKTLSRIYGAFINVDRPASPTGVVASVNSNTSVSMRWNRVPVAHYYAVFRAIGWAADSLDLQIIANCRQTSFVDDDVHDGSKYVYQIAAVVSNAELVENSGAVGALSKAMKVEVKPPTQTR